MIGPITNPAAKVAAKIAIARPLRRVHEQLTDHGKARWQKCRAAQTHQRPGYDQDPGGGGERRAHGPDAENGCPGEKKFLPAEPVPEIAKGDEQRTDDEPVDVEDPEGLISARPDRFVDARDRQEKYGTIHGDHEHGAKSCDQTQPGPGRGTFGRVLPEIHAHHAALPAGERQEHSLGYPGAGYPRIWGRDPERATLNP